MKTVADNVNNCPMVEVLEQAESWWVKTLRLDGFWRQQEARPPLNHNDDSTGGRATD